MNHTKKENGISFGNGMIAFAHNNFLNLFSQWRYSSLPSTQLKRLPIPLLASPNCLVVTWVTNRPSHLRFVRDELYPHWGVEVVAEWFWVKVQTSWIDSALNHGNLTHWCDYRCFKGLLFSTRSPHLGSLCFLWIHVIRSHMKCWCWADIVPL